MRRRERGGMVAPAGGLAPRAVGGLRRRAIGHVAPPLVEYLPAVVVFVAAIVAWELAVGALNLQTFVFPKPVGDRRRAPGELDRRPVPAPARRRSRRSRRRWSGC